MKHQKVYWIKNDLSIGYLCPETWSATKLDEKRTRIDFKKYIINQENRIILSDQKWKIIHDRDGFILYEGMTKDGMPNGVGTLYYDNGIPYREGIFSNGGFIAGTEYRYSGIAKFVGVFERNPGCENYPKYGSFYDEVGLLKYNGEFKVRRQDTIVPIVEFPEGYGLVIESDSPHLDNAAGYYEIVSNDEC